MKQHLRVIYKQEPRFSFLNVVVPSFFLFGLLSTRRVATAGEVKLLPVAKCLLSDRIVTSVEVTRCLLLPLSSLEFMAQQSSSGEINEQKGCQSCVVQDT